MKSEAEIQQRAEAKVRRLKAFYIHLAAYLLVNAILIAVDLVGGTSDLWFHWPLLGWGAGLLLHAAAVFIGHGSFLERWESRKIQEFKQKEAQQGN